MTTSVPPLLRVEEVSKSFHVALGAFGSRRATVNALDQVSFTIQRGETLGVVGESGCGKSTAGLAIAALQPPDSGRVLFDGEDLTTLRGRALRNKRKRFQMVFQDPFSTFSPRMTIGDAIADAVIAHAPGRRKADVATRVAALLRDVGLAAGLAERYPHELSGGQCQRAAIARALATEPDLLICDEAVSALDVSIQAQIVELLARLQRERGIAYLFISHDLAIVWQLSTRVAVMYLGRLAEIGPRDSLFGAPLHPYTQALLASVPDFEGSESQTTVGLQGEVPSPLHPPSGCRFHPRCPRATSRCATEVPAWRQVRADHWVACHQVE
jgi:peptide/nickel transport system ATP-binding protein